MENSVAVDILEEFLEVAVHSVLYERQIYPHNVFEKRKKYNVPVYMSIHPGINKYIQSVIESIKVLLPNNLEKISVVIVNKENKPLEKFVFEIDVNHQNDVGTLDDAYLVRLEQAIRAFCLKLITCGTLLKPLPSDCSFAIHICTNESAAANLEIEDTQMRFPWIEADPHQTNLAAPHIIPLKYMDHKLFKMQLYIEESNEKR